jgi:hypothetical protein
MVGAKSGSNRHADTKSHEQVKMAKQPNPNCSKSKSILRFYVLGCRPKCRSNLSEQRKTMHSDRGDVGLIGCKQIVANQLRLRCLPTSRTLSGQNQRTEFYVKMLIMNELCKFIVCLFMKSII